ncbi:MAG TPA: ParB/RepB/Spo0J family partition protein, partial [Nitrospiraceae bacterium]|nr:ParB/RepB/Spo0J family partition protein [Nitrospiraceae bacterium]
MALELSTWFEDRQKLEQMKPDGLTEEERSLRRLPIASLRTMPSVFQPRVEGMGTAGTAECLEALKDALEKQGSLDPVKVWKRGGIWWVVDGHHRLAVYQDAASAENSRRTTVPVKVLEGSLDEVLREAWGENSKYKFNLSAEDRAEMAWREVLLEKLSAKEISKAALVSERLVFTMRAGLKELRERFPDVKWECWPWKRVKQGKRMFFDELGGRNAAWESKKRRELREAVVRAFSGDLGRYPRLCAEATREAYGEVAD